MRCVILSSGASPALLYSSTLSHNWHDFLKEKKILNIICVFSFSLKHLSETFIVLRKIRRDLIDAHQSSLMKLKSSRQILENSSSIKFHENPSSGWRDDPRGRTDGHTDATKITFALRGFANAPQNSLTRRSCRSVCGTVSQPIYLTDFDEKMHVFPDQLQSEN